MAGGRKRMQDFVHQQYGGYVGLYGDMGAMRRLYRGYIRL